MLKKFKDFDVQDYLKLKSITEKNTNSVDTIDTVDVEDLDIPTEEVITGTPVYDNPALLKLSSIVKKRLANIGEFGIFHDIVYLDGVPGVWFYGLNDTKVNVVCCRNVHIKTISIFDEFELGKENVAKVVYSTEKLGYKDMISQMIYDLQESKPVYEGVVEEAKRYGLGFTKDHVVRFEKLPWGDKDIAYDYIRRYSKKDAAEMYYTAIQSKSVAEINILKAFTGKPIASGDGQTRTLIDCIYTVVNAATGGSLSGSFKAAVDDGVLDNLIAEYKSNTGGSPAISTSSGVTFAATEVDDDEEESRLQAMQARREAMLKEDMENYEETIRGLRDVTEAMCNYVKQNGKLDREDKSVMSRRGVLLTGKGGIGKTHTLKKVLREKHMLENKDYVWISSDQTTSDALYSTMYEYNGKLIIFDDAPKLFDGEYRVSMWKNALQTDIEDCKIGYPKGDTKLNVYNIRRLKGDRQKQYFMEIGKKSLDDKGDFYKKEMKKHGLSYSKNATNGVHSIDPTMNDNDIQALMSKIDDAWKEEEENTQPSMPNQFIFRGVVVIISNDTRDKFEQSVGKGGWEAITSRFRNFDISPMAESLWGVMKKNILDEYNNKSLDDDLCTIPRNMTEEFIAEVESLISDPTYSGINWRTIRAFGDILRGQKGLRTWKRTLREELSI